MYVYVNMYIYIYICSGETIAKFGWFPKCVPQKGMVMVIQKSYSLMLTNSLICTTKQQPYYMVY